MLGAAVVVSVCLAGEHISAAAKDLEAHNCHGVIDELDPGGATGADGRNRDADTQESNAVDALEELAK